MDLIYGVNSINIILAFKLVIGFRAKITAIPFLIFCRIYLQSPCAKSIPLCTHDVVTQ